MERISKPNAPAKSRKEKETVPEEPVTKPASAQPQLQSDSKSKEAGPASPGAMSPKSIISLRNTVKLNGISSPKIGRQPADALSDILVCSMFNVSLYSDLDRVCAYNAEHVSYVYIAVRERFDRRRAQMYQECDRELARQKQEWDARIALLAQDADEMISMCTAV